MYSNLKISILRVKKTFFYRLAEFIFSGQNIANTGQSDTYPKLLPTMKGKEFINFIILTILNLNFSTAQIKAWFEEYSLTTNNDLQHIPTDPQ